MSMTIEEISGMLTRLRIPNSIDEKGDLLVIPFPTHYYVNPDGEKSVELHISLRDYKLLGQVFTLRTAHSLFATKGSVNRDALLKYCSLMQGNPDPVQFIYDMHDASVRARIEIPLADNKLTQGQVDLSLGAMVTVIEAHYEDFKKILDTGELPEDVRKKLLESEGHPETTRL